MFSRITVKKESCGPGPSVGHVPFQGCDKMLTSLVHRRKRRGQLYRQTVKTVARSGRGHGLHHGQHVPEDNG